MITASHNPEEYNGLKFFNEDGEFLSREDVTKLIDYSEQNRLLLLLQFEIISFKQKNSRKSYDKILYIVIGILIIFFRFFILKT